MKKTSKRILGGFMVVMLIATIGAVVASANPGFLSDLTDEQKQELKEIRYALKEDGASCEEIRDAMHEQLESWGIEPPTREEILDLRIERTEQKLEVLNRIKELIEENPDITKEEIQEIIQEEFNLEFPMGNGNGMKYRKGFRNGYRKCISDSVSDE